MKIAVNARFLIENKLEGIGWYSHEVLRRLVQLGSNHEFLFLFDRKYSEKFIFGKNVIGQILYPSARHPLLWYYWFEHALPNVLKSWNADVFFSPDGYCSLNADVKQMMVMHDLAYLHYPEQIPWMARNYYRHFVPKYLRKADHVFAVSQATKNDIVDNLHIDPNKISIAYNGARQLFQPILELDKQKVKDDYTDGKNYFLFVGAIHPRKNVRNLILAFDLFKTKKRSEYKLLIVGRKAWQTQAIDQAYHHAQHREDIIFCDYLDTKDLARVTASAMCAVCPSFLEGFGVPALEALCCDIPLIVSDRFSLPEVAGPGAIKVNPDSIDSMADAMLEISTDPHLISRIDAGRLHRLNFNWDHTATHIMEQIESRGRK